MSLGDLLEDGDFVSDHVLATLHQLLVDDFAGIVLACGDVDGFLDDCVRAAAQCAASAVLLLGGSGSSAFDGDQYLGVGQPCR